MKEDQDKTKQELIAELQQARSRITKLESMPGSCQNFENTYKKIADNAPVGIAIVQSEKIVYVNNALARMLGYSFEEFAKFSITDLTGIFCKKAQFKILQSYNESKDQKPAPGSCELKCKTKNGDTCWLDSQVQLIEFGGKQAFFCTYRDITKFKQIEQELVESENRFRAIAESALDSIFCKDRQRRYTYVNPAMERLLGAKAEDLVGKTPVEIFGEEAAEVIREVDDPVFDGKNVNEISTLSIGEQKLVFHTVQVPLHDDSGQIKEISGIVRDITEQKKAESIIREKVAQFETLFAHSLTPILVVNEQGYYIDANKAALDFLECSREELLEKQVWDFDHPDFHNKQLKEHNPFLKPRTLETDYYIHGVIKTLLLNVVPVQLHDRVILYGIGLDITERKRTEKVISENEARFRELFDNINSGVAIYHTPDNGKTFIFKDFNKAGRRIENVHKEDLLHKNVEDIFPGIKEFGLLTVFREVYKTGNPKLHPVSLYKDDRIYGWRENYVFKLPSGEIVAVYEDLTEKKKYEERILDSLREKEILLKEIHHRVKNNLQTISSLISLQTMYVNDKNVVSHLNNTADRIKSMGIIHEKLYQNDNFARIDFADYIHTIVEELFNSYSVNHALVKRDIKISQVFFSIDTAIPCGLIINEIVTNSLKYAFPDNRNGLISIRLNSTGSDMADRVYTLTIADNGTGIPESVSFEQNHGLGMQLIHMLTRQLRGDIEIIRKKGTKYIIHFKEVNNKITR